MRLLVQFLDGSIKAAILGASLGSRLRVFIPGSEDTVEFRWEGGRWVAADGAPVELRFEPPEHEFLLHAHSAPDETSNPLNRPFGFQYPRTDSHARLN